MPPPTTSDVLTDQGWQPRDAVASPSDPPMQVRTDQGWQPRSAPDATTLVFTNEGYQPRDQVIPGVPIPQAAYYADELPNGPVASWPDAFGSLALTQSVALNQPTKGVDPRTGQDRVSFSATTSLLAAVGAFDFLHEKDVTILVAWRSQNLYNAIFNVLGTSTGAASKGYRLQADNPVPPTAINSVASIAISNGAADVIAGPTATIYGTYPPLLFTITAATTSETLAEIYEDAIEGFSDAQAGIFPAGNSAIPLTLGGAAYDIAAIEIYTPALTPDVRDQAAANLSARVNVPEVVYLAKDLGPSLAPVGPTRHRGFPSLCKAPNGDLVAVWREGATHASDVGAIKCRRSTDDGASWQAEFTIISGMLPTTDVRDSCLSTLSTGDILLNYFENDTISGISSLKLLRSSDNGLTWPGPPQSVATSYTLWSASSGPIVERAGKLLLPFYAENIGDPHSSIALMQSADFGTTWPTQLLIRDGVADGKDYEEPNLLALLSGNVFCVTRIGGATDCVEQTSADGGATWSAPVASVHANGSPRLIQFADGVVASIARQSNLASTCLFRRLGASHWSGGWPGGDGDMPQQADALYSLNVYGAIIESSSGDAALVYGIQISNTHGEIHFRHWPEWQIKALDNPNVTISPAAPTVPVGGNQLFTAVDGVGPFVFSIPVNNSGATISPATGLYSNPVNPSVTDTVRVTDYLGHTSDATVTVPALWDPTHLTGLTLWADPAVGVSTTLGLVTGWLDQSGAGNNLAGSGNITQTNNINGRDTITTNGTSGIIFATGALPISTFISAAKWLIGFVWQDTGSPAGGPAYYQYAQIVGDATGGFWNTGTDGTQIVTGQYDGANKQTSGAIGAGAHYVIAWYDGVNVNLSIDGGAATTVAAGNITDVTKPLRLLETTFGALYAKGDLGDVVLCNDNNTAPDRAQLVTYLKTKYGL